MDIKGLLSLQSANEPFWRDMQKYPTTIGTSLPSKHKLLVSKNLIPQSKNRLFLGLKAQ
jgi:hypothetical protein